ncbi:MAG: isochorismate synthase [Bacteroidota bacterium]
MPIINKDNFTDFFTESLKSQNSSNTIFQYIQPIDKDLFEKDLNLLTTPHDHFYWSYPFSNFTFFGIDELKNLQIDYTDYDYIVIRNDRSIDDSTIPLFIGGLKFPLEDKSNLWQDFKSSGWFVPRILFVSSNLKSFLVINFTEKDFHNNNLVNNIDQLLHEVKITTGNLGNYELAILDSSPFAEWKQSVNKSLELISTGSISKVVLARKLTALFSPHQSIVSITKALEEQYPECFTFSYKRNNSIFFGSTPEKLLNVNKDIIETEALAGSIKRGKDFWEDEILSSQLINNPKDIEEHKSVLDFIATILGEYCGEISYEKKPLIKKLKNILHIWTPIKAKLKDEKSIFQVIQKIYPTPAVCGFPKEKALSVINELEDFDRGMYAGLIGWFNKSHGEFAVAIRSALIKDKKLHAFAGCGIVNGSVAESEFQETELKFKPILSLFENETISQS